MNDAVREEALVAEETLAAEFPLAMEPEQVVAEADSIIRRRLLLFALLAVVVIILDQFSKLWIRAVINLNHDVPLVSGWVHLTHTLNRGAAWSMFSGQRWFLVGVTVVVIGVVVMLARDFAQRGSLPIVGLGLVLGGAIGNLIDRVLAGAVTDMIDLDTPFAWLQTFPVFNVADSALTVGVVVLLFYTFFGGRREAQSLKENTT